MIAGFRGNPALGNAPGLFHLVAEFFFFNQPMTRQNMTETAALAYAATGIGLAGERETVGARFQELAGEDMQIVDQVVGPDSLFTLIDAHGPHTHCSLGGGKPAGCLADILGRGFATHGPRRLFRCVIGHEFLVFLEIDFDFLSLTKCRVFIDKILIIEFFFNNDIGHGIEQGQISARIELDMEIGNS